jgi:hypothetical protein
MILLLSVDAERPIDPGKAPGQSLICRLPTLVAANTRALVAKALIVGADGLSVAKLKSPLVARKSPRSLAGIEETESWMGGRA